jgi:hypothetical protein
MSRLSRPARAFLQEIVSHYWESHDFNGIPLDHLVHRRPGDAINIVEELVQRRLVEINSGRWDNPHIKRVPLPAVNIQLTELRMGNFVCLYPSTRYLKKVIPRRLYRNKPFNRLLALGYPQLEPVFFELNVLNRYQSDARYSFQFWGLNGSIGLTEKYYRSREVSTADKVLVEAFGLASNAKGQRLVAVFLRYLTRLSARHQGYWNSHRVAQRSCRVEYNYYHRSIFGEWTAGISVYTALLDELGRINKLCQVIGWPHLFRKDFSGKPPKGFGLLMNTTKREYLNFAHLLDKVISENLNYAFFAALHISLVDEANERKGTLTLLQEWLIQEIHVEHHDAAAILAPLKRTRKVRQPTAHSIVDDEFSHRYQKRKEELIKDVYSAIRRIRELLQNHPRATRYEIKREPQLNDIVVY